MKAKKSAEAYFLGKAISRELKKWKAGKIKDLSWLSSFATSPSFWLVWEGISAKINEDLKAQGLWHRDGDGVVIPQENGIPSLKKRKSYSAEKLDDADESIYDPEALDEIYLEERIAEGEELEPEDGATDAAPTNEEQGGDSLHPYLPRLAVPSSHLLMRRYPLDLKESIARDLFDSYAYLTGVNRSLLPALCFFEVGINEPETFKRVWEEAYQGGQFHKSGKKFSFEDFQKDKLRLFHRLKRERERYFDRNPWLKQEKRKVSLWERFFEAYNSLTRKQWNALKQVRVKRRTQEDVAKDMRIDPESLRNRLESAELKFRRAIPELAGFFPSKTHRKSQKTNYIHDGLFDKREKAASLYRIDLETGEKTEIPKRKGKKKYKKGVDVARIKAWAHDSTPVPDFSFTDFFTGLISDGALLRQKAGEKAFHDRVSGRHSFSDRMKAHEKRRSSSDFPDDEPSDD
jgi:hypothetical protein